jgi:hypothetical protein
VGPHDPAEEAQATLVRSFRASQMRLDELWLAYFALGGNAGRYELEAYLSGLMPLAAHEHNVLALAINERLAQIPPSPWAPFRSAPPETHRQP